LPPFHCFGIAVLSVKLLWFWGKGLKKEGKKAEKRKMETALV